MPFSRNIIIVVLLMCSGLLYGASAQEIQTESAHALPRPVEVLRRVRSSFPSVPIELNAQLLSRDRNGNTDQTMNVAITLRWAAAVPSAQYVLADAFGAEVAQFKIQWIHGDQPAAELFRNGARQELSDLSECIEGLDFSWADLSLSFLWWTEGQTVGMESKKGRQCYVLDMQAPEEHASTYQGVRLWVDADMYMLLEAEGYNTSGQRLRKLEIKSFKKVDEVWTLQNLDIQSYPSRHKTTLRVRDMGPSKTP